MSINNPVEIFYYENRDSYILKRGRETFYDEDRRMLEFDTEKDAQKWAKENEMATVTKKVSRKSTKKAAPKRKAAPKAAPAKKKAPAEAGSKRRGLTLARPLPRGGIVRTQLT